MDSGCAVMETKLECPIAFKEELESLNEQLDDLEIEDEFQELTNAKTNGGESFMFLDEDDDFQCVLAEGGPNPSTCVDQWALNRLDAFIKFKKMDYITLFVDMLPLVIVALLTKFFEQTCKLDGNLYPTQTLMALYRAFHRILRKSQEACIMSIGVDELILSLKSSPIFKRVGYACAIAMKCSRSAGANLPRKKAAVISMVDESVILSLTCTSLEKPRGLQKRACYFLLTRFCIHGGTELLELPADNFLFESDKTGQYVHYDERCSKNYKVSLECYQDEHFRLAITEYDPDVVATMESLIRHLPVSMNTSTKYLFYQAIDNLRIVAWYSSNRVSMRNLSKWMKLIHEDCGSLLVGVTNKSGRTTCVTRMAAEGVPPSIGMLIMGHKSQGAYARYDRSTEAQVRAAQKTVNEGTPYDAGVKKEKANMKRITLQGTSMDYSVLVALKKKKSGEKSVKANSEDTKAIEVTDATEATEGSEMTSDSRDSLSEQTIEEFDRWADDVDWDDVDGQLARKGIYIGKKTVANPISNMYKMQNCNVTISVGHLPLPAASASSLSLVE